MTRAAGHKHGQMVFPQGQHEGDVVLGKVIVKGNPVLPRALPLFDDRIIIIGKFLCKTQFHKAAEGCNRLRKRGNKAVRQTDVHGVQQIASGLVQAFESIAGNSAHEP